MTTINKQWNILSIGVNKNISKRGTEGLNIMKSNLLIQTIEALLASTNSTASVLLVDVFILACSKETVRPTELKYRLKESLFYVE